MLGKNKNKNEAKEKEKRGTQLVKARVETGRQTWTKKRSYSANEAKRRERRNKKHYSGTGNVRDMQEGGGNTSTQKVRICATMTSQ